MQRNLGVTGIDRGLKWAVNLVIADGYFNLPRGICAGYMG